MNILETDSLHEHTLPDIPPDYWNGVHVKLEGGEEDPTIRPSQALRGLVARDEGNNGFQEAAPEEARSADPAPSKVAIAPGPDLRDWLSRTFD